MTTATRCLIAGLVFGAFAGCDDKPEPAAQTATQTVAKGAPQPGDDKISAEPAYRGLPDGTTFRAELTSRSVIPTPPTKEMRRRTGQLRAVDIETTLKARFDATKVEREPAEDAADGATRPESWNLSFEVFEKVTERADLPTATTSHDFPDQTFQVDLVDDEADVRLAKDDTVGEATGFQTKFATAIANDLATRDDWGKFLASREFPQGKIVEVPEGLVLGRFATAFFGPITEAHTTVALFRLGMEDESEVAIFEVNNRMKSASEQEGEEIVIDFETKGKLVVRIIDGLILRYNLDSRIVPRNKAGAMLSSGSGAWDMTFSIDPSSVQRPE